MDTNGPRIVVDPTLLVGKPVIRSTGISMELVLEFIADGWTKAKILDSYLGVSHDDVVACRGHTGRPALR